MTINNNTFLISGAASGLGYASAQMIIENGGNAIIADINATLGTQAAQALGDKALFIHTDITSEASVQAALETAKKTFGTIQGAISCAGIGAAQRVLGKSGIHPLESFTRTIQINLIGTFNLLRLASEAMQHNLPNAGGERGVIINTASIAAYDGQIGQAAYAASKGGIVAMTLPIARELARFGIRVMTIAPGIFETPMLLNLTDQAKEALSKNIPFPSRLGKPNEYAHLVQHIIENTMLNGETIRLDAATRLQ
jgi:NAD(P)-dependent dehydrogenase (short-subunit alcohol dehydrogenase family)